MASRVEIDQAGLYEIFESPDGPLAAFLTLVVVRVANRAKKLCPVDTGRLRSSLDWSIELESGKMYGIVGTNVEYAIYVEFGTTRMAAQPYLIPALYGVLGV
jgi:HK97 gp10 family phage protein